MFATALPGLGPLLAAELDSVDGLTVRDLGFDSRSDLVLFDAKPAALRHVTRLRIAEDVFVEVGRTLRSSGDRPEWIAGRIWRPERIGRALQTRSTIAHTPSKKTTYRVIVRVLQERSFLRVNLRREFAKAVARDQPYWRVADPAQLEIWVTEYQAGKLVAGFRATDVRMRQHDGRAEERMGALRPTMAAAMVHLAGEPQGVLLDPCCGSGTILAEANEAGWQPRGSDIDPEAVRITRVNAPDAAIDEGDARDLKLTDRSVGACVSNLPFGQQYGVQGDMDEWLRSVLTEMARVTRQGGRVVLLAPSIPRALVPKSMRMSGRHPVRLLGTRTTIWVFDRI